MNLEDIYERKILAEKNLYYNIPKNKKSLMFDFYLLTLLYSLAGEKQRVINDDGLRESIREAVEDELLPKLKKHMLKAVAFAISAEFRHIFDQNSSTDLVKWFDKRNQKKFIQDYFKSLKIRKVFLADDPLNPKDISTSIDRRFKEDRNAYQASWNAVLDTKIPIPDFIRIAHAAFNELKWANQYGGKAWASISNGWLKLYNAKSIGDMMSYIDHVYDLQHNTDTVFNKLKSYYADGGYDWIKNALDFKASIRSPWRLVDEASPISKSFASYLSRDLKYETKEDFLKKLNEIEWAEYNDKVAKAKAKGFSWQGPKPTVPDPSKHAAAKPKADAKPKAAAKGSDDTDNGYAVKEVSKSGITNYYDKYKNLSNLKGPAVVYPYPGNDINNNEYFIAGHQFIEKSEYDLAVKQVLKKYINPKGGWTFNYVDGEGYIQHIKMDFQSFNTTIHRLDGPAVWNYAEFGDYGQNLEAAEREWWLNDTQYDQVEWMKEASKLLKAAKLKKTVSTDVGLYIVNKGQMTQYYKDREMTILHRVDGPAVEWTDGDKWWYLNGKRHREDGPAVECANGDKVWYINDKLHREDGPAIERADGSKEWYLNDELHREDGPAVEYVDGSKWWYLNGKLHREDGPAIERADGTKLWYLNGELHREDGPAVEYVDGSKVWYINDKLHREDGPAIERADGTKLWYLNGEEYIEKDWKKAVAKLKKGHRQLPNLSKINLDLDLPPLEESAPRITFKRYVAKTRKV